MVQRLAADGPEARPPDDALTPAHLDLRELAEERVPRRPVREHDEVSVARPVATSSRRATFPVKTTVPSAGARTAEPAGAASSSPVKNSAAPVHGETRGPKSTAGSTRPPATGSSEGVRAAIAGSAASRAASSAAPPLELGEVARQPGRDPFGVGAGEPARLGVEALRPVGRRHAVQEGDPGEQASRVPGPLGQALRARRDAAELRRRRGRSRRRVHRPRCSRRRALATAGTVTQSDTAANAAAPVRRMATFCPRAPRTRLRTAPLPGSRVKLELHGAYRARENGDEPSSRRSAERPEVAGHECARKGEPDDPRLAPAAAASRSDKPLARAQLAPEHRPPVRFGRKLDVAPLGREVGEGQAHRLAGRHPDREPALRPVERTARPLLLAVEAHAPTVAESLVRRKRREGGDEQRRRHRRRRPPGTTTVPRAGRARATGSGAAAPRATTAANRKKSRARVRREPVRAHGEGGEKPEHPGPAPGRERLLPPARERGHTLAGEHDREPQRQEEADRSGLGEGLQVRASGVVAERQRAPALGEKGRKLPGERRRDPRPRSGRGAKRSTALAQRTGRDDARASAGRAGSRSCARRSPRVPRSARRRSAAERRGVRAAQTDREEQPATRGQARREHERDESHAGEKQAAAGARQDETRAARGRERQRPEAPGCRRRRAAATAATSASPHRMPSALGSIAPPESRPVIFQNALVSPGGSPSRSATAAAPETAAAGERRAKRPRPQSRAGAAQDEEEPGARSERREREHGLPDRRRVEQSLDVDRAQPRPCRTAQSVRARTIDRSVASDQTAARSAQRRGPRARDRDDSRSRRGTGRSSRPRSPRRGAPARRRRRRRRRPGRRGPTGGRETRRRRAPAPGSTPRASARREGERAAPGAGRARRRRETRAEKTAKKPAAVAARAARRATPPGRRARLRRSCAVVLLQRRDPGRLLLARADSLDGRGGGRERRQARDREAQRRRPDRGLVEARLAAERRVDDELDLPGLHPVDGVGAALVDLEDPLRVDARLLQRLARALRRAEREAEVRELARRSESPPPCRTD